MPERRDRHVQALLDLERQLARGDLVDAAEPVTISRSHAGQRLGGLLEARRAGRACPSITRVQVAASAAPAIAVKASSGET